MPGYDVQQDLGDHEVEVVENDLIESEPGKLVVKLVLRFKDGERGTKDLYPIASEKSAELTRKALRAVSFDVDTQDLGDLQRNKTLLAGKRCIAVIQENEYNGKVTNRIAFLNAIKKPAGKSLIEEAMRRIRKAKKGGEDDAL